LDVFWQRTTGTLGHKWRWEGAGAHDASWSTGVEDLGGGPSSGIDAISQVPNVIDVVGTQSQGKDVVRLLWNGNGPANNPWYNDPPGVPTTVFPEHTVSSGSQVWEYSAVVAPPGTTGCSGGAYVVSGDNFGTDLRKGSPLTVPTVSNNLASLLMPTPDLAIENDSMMARAPNGDLLLARGVNIDASCGGGEENPCTQQTCPGGTRESRSGTAVWRSSNCGQTWNRSANDTIDPISTAYGNGTFGGGPCWGGWDREEIYFDYFSNRLFLTFGAETDISTNVRSVMMLRSAAGGAGPYTMHQFKIGDVIQPITMTSLPGMMFFATCEGLQPTLRWIEPTNSHWNDAWNLGFTESSTIMRKAQLPGSCSYGPDWGLEGSQSVSRVGTYTDDGGTKWWVVRVAMPDPPNVRVISVRVNAAGTAEQLWNQVFTIGTGPAGQTQGRVVQLTMIEPDPSQTLLANGSWSGENTTLYYWREEYWTSFASGAKMNTANVVRARAVRDIYGWGSVFDVSGFRDGIVTTHAKGVMPGDFARGGFWVDNNASAANDPLRYLVTWGEVPINSLRAKAFAFPRGLGSN
jgi:hypothetical protein